MAPTLSTTGRPRNARTCITALPAGRPTAWRPPRRGERLITPINQKHAADHPLTAVAPPSEAVAVAAPTPAPTTADRSVWFKNWWAIAATDALDETRPNPLELMGDKLVAWKDAEGQWVVQADRCPHRSAPLSDGFVAKDRQAIVCSYHGYQFNGCGACIKITALANDPAAEKTACSSRRSRLRTLPVREEAGLIFVWPDPESADAAADAAAAPPPPVPDVVRDDILAPRHRWYPRALPFDWSLHTENVLDAAHANFAHSGVAGMSGTSPPTFDIEIAEGNKAKGFVLRQKMHDPSRRASFIRFEAPAMVRYEPDPDSGLAPVDPTAKAEARPGDPSGTLDTHLIFYASPLRPGWTLLLGASAILDRATGKPSKLASIFGDALPAWLRHLLGGAFLAGDAYSLARASTTYAKEGRNWRRSYFMPSSADVSIVALRRWMEEHGGGPDVPMLPPSAAGVGVLGPPAENTLRLTRGEAALDVATKDKLLDRYHTHIVHGPACLSALEKTRTAHGWARSVALAAAGSAIVIATAAAQHALASLSAVSTSGWAVSAATAIVRFTRGAPLAAVVACVGVAVAAAVAARAAAALEGAMLSTTFDREKHKFA